MRRATLLVAMLAVLAGTASASAGGRNLQQLANMVIPHVPLPPITEFLPPMDQVNLPPLDEFLNKTGLPSWEELGLPPISELMRPVGGPQSMKLPSLADIARQADEVTRQVVYELLPPELKKFYKVKKDPVLKRGPFKLNLTDVAHKLNVTLPPALAGVKLPNLPAEVPPLQELLKGLNLPFNLTKDGGANGTGGIDVHRLQLLAEQPIVLPPLKMPNGLPPLEDVYKAVVAADKFLNGVNSKKEGLPSLDQVMKVVNGVSQALNGAPGLAAGGNGGKLGDVALKAFNEFNKGLATGQLPPAALSALQALSAAATSKQAGAGAAGLGGLGAALQAGLNGAKVAGRPVAAGPAIRAASVAKPAGGFAKPAAAFVKPAAVGGTFAAKPIARPVAAGAFKG